MSDAIRAKGWIEYEGQGGYSRAASLVGPDEADKLLAGWLRGHPPTLNADVRDLATSMARERGIDMDEAGILAFVSMVRKFNGH